MNIADANMYLVIVVTISAATGITLFFVGSLVAIASAFALDKKVFAIACILFLPLTIVYCALHYSQATYAARYVFSGLALFLLTLFLSIYVL